MSTKTNRKRLKNWRACKLKIYIAADSVESALAVADALRTDHELVSTWHNLPMRRTANIEPRDRSAIAGSDALEISTCDTLVLISGLGKCPGGKFVEAGIAIGIGKRVVIYGHRENLLLWHPSVECHGNLTQMSAALVPK